MIYVFGNNDVLVLPKLDPKSSPLSRTTLYTNPSLRIFYSQYGFAFPTTEFGIPFDIAMDNKFAIQSDHVKLHVDPKFYLLIDHDGNVWRTVIQEDTPGKNILSYSYVDIKHSGWWLATIKGDEYGPDRDALLGFLYTNPTRVKIEKYWKTYRMGSDIEWLSIKEIVKTLHTLYPKPPVEVPAEKK